ncbi:hypothetical protein [Polaromonas sp.]|jgi:hypothetical protein|uniref:hypothetical protein n=1 Tax=Polaromonas sp. TaxID=1869339 RepID=UPI0037C9D34F
MEGAPALRDRTTARSAHVKPGDAEFVPGGLRGFFLSRDRGIAGATHGKVIARLAKANMAPETARVGTTMRRIFRWLSWFRAAVASCMHESASRPLAAVADSY